MPDLTKTQSWMKALRTGAIARVIAALVNGSLNQKVIVLVGLVAVAYAVYTLLSAVWLPLLIGTVGAVIIGLAVKDYEKPNGKDK